MPEINEIKKGEDIGRKPSLGKFIWLACSNCGKERWVALRRGKPRSSLCILVILGKLEEVGYVLTPSKWQSFTL